VPASNDIHQRVTKVLVDALGVDEDAVKPSATLQGDLGAESIDFLDIVFRLEREFPVKIRQGELFPERVFQLTEIVSNGEVTDEGLAELRTLLPFADLNSVERDRRLNRIDDLFTVDLLSRFIAWKLGAGTEAASDANAPAERHSSRELTQAVVRAVS
jgi:acyl carrier protein